MKAGRWKSAPIALLTTLAFQRSTVPGMRDDGRGAERGRRSEDGADVAGVLDGVEHDDAGAVGEHEVVERAVGDLARWRARPAANRSRRRWRTRARRRSVSSTPRVADGSEQCGAAGRVGELRSGEHAAHRERRAQELLDGANAFGDEELLALARPPSPEVAG